MHVLMFIMFGCLPSHTHQCLTAVISPSNVTYSCPRVNGVWSPATFALQAVASAGPAGCSGQGLSIPANVVITARPTTVSVMLIGGVTPSICSYSTTATMSVPLRVTASGGVPVTVPATVTASDGRVCTFQGNTTTGKLCETCRTVVARCLFESSGQRPPYRKQANLPMCACLFDNQGHRA
jgi:hypothetical protein